MPPFIPRKRRKSTPPSHHSTPSKTANKPTLFDTLDKPKVSASIQANNAFLTELDDSGSSSSLSDAESSDFEDILPAEHPPKRRKVAYDDEDEEEIDWEDAIQPSNPTSTITDIEPSGDLELTLDKGARIGSLTNPHDKKQGPSKIERQIRISTHRMHVQFLLFHNLVRNSWACDEETQKSLVGQLSEQMKTQVERWTQASGLANGESIETSQRQSQEGRPSRGRGRGRGSGKTRRGQDDDRNQRDWGVPAERQEKGVPDLSKGDPIIRLLRYLAAYWKKRFRITAPRLRKQGYKPLSVLEEEVASFQNDKHNAEEHGEKIPNLEAFRECARLGEGSEDIGHQLFTAMIRGLGIEARLVASLQPIGFGWNKAEEATVRKKKRSIKQPTLKDTEKSDDDGGSQEESNFDQEGYSRNDQPKLESKVKAKAKQHISSTKNTRSGAAGLGRENAPIELPDESYLSSVPPSDIDENEDDESVIDVTPSRLKRKPNVVYDKDMSYPTYWTEVISPLTHEIYPVNSLTHTPPVFIRRDELAAFEPRGPKAEKAKQVIAYVIAYSPDGTAKDVTTRYLKNHMWPGKTKGVRIPVEKVPILNRNGKVKRYEEFDWFKTVMSGYLRTEKMRTAVDDLEEVKDLKPVKPEKKIAKEGEETLQGYKQSAEFVLERHLRREEALLPKVKPVRTFVAGKGENLKEEPVFRRKDVVICRTGESWHKEGRQVKAGEYPMKMVPVRAVTLTRKREVEEAERDGGEKLKQGLYAWDQTEWIIPPPIENGVIPKNAFGNMDCYVPTMVPEGAVHIPLLRTMRICKRLGIDFAEAVTGFEFGKQRAVPVVTGVVVASEHEDLVIDEWEKDEAERRIKEEGKRERIALAMWKKFFMGLRIVERFREEYGDDVDAHMKEELNPFTNKKKRTKPSITDTMEHPPQTNGSSAHDDLNGVKANGFLPDPGEDDMEGGGFFQPGHEEEELEVHGGGGFIVEDAEMENDNLPEPIMKLTPGKFRLAELSDASGSGGHHDTETEFRLKSRPKVTNGHAVKTPTNDVEHVKRRTSGRTGTANAKPKSAKKEHKFRVSSRNKEHGSSEGSSGSEASCSESPPRLSGLPITRELPKRNAASKSKIAVKSHYFEHDTEEDDTSALSFSTEEEVLTKSSADKKRSGDSLRAKRQTGRVRGRGRGRARKTI